MSTDTKEEEQEKEKEKKGKKILYIFPDPAGKREDEILPFYPEKADIDEIMRLY